MSNILKNDNSILEAALINRFDSCYNNVSNDVVGNARKLGAESFKKIGLPGKKAEKWRGTNIQDIYNDSYSFEENKPAFDKQINEIFHCSIHGFNTDVFALLNGWYYNSDDKQIVEMDDGIIVGSIIAASKKYPEIFSKYFNKLATNAPHGFSAINTALFSDGLFVYVPDNTSSEKAIQLIKIVDHDRSNLINSRNLIVVGKNSSLSFLHCDDSINHHQGLLGTNNEVFLEENAKLDLYKLQNLNDKTTLINTTFVHQEAGSDLNVNVLTFNGGSIRNEFFVDLQGELANADIRGMYLIDKDQHIDNQVKINHNSPNCTSNELFKGVLDDKASAVFNGHIYVARDAQQTIAFQKNANILMTSDATINTRPFLEIYADDVKCSHGATVGQLDDDALFYMMQRGICKKDARLLLMYAFVNEVTDRINIDVLKQSIDDMVRRRLRGDLSICDKCVLQCSNPEKPVEFDIDLSKI